MSEPALTSAEAALVAKAHDFARERAIVDYSVKLSQTPPAAGQAEIAALRAAGCSDAEILDLANAVALFAWANRLMLTLGEPVFPEPEEMER